MIIGWFSTVKYFHIEFRLLLCERRLLSWMKNQFYDDNMNLRLSMIFKLPMEL